MAPPRRAPIRTESIALGALLKWTGVARTGGAAKQLIHEGRVAVNGVVERRRGRHLYPGDQVEVDGRAFVIERAEPR